MVGPEAGSKKYASTNSMVGCWGTGEYKQRLHTNVDACQAAGAGEVNDNDR
jgi:hypothetical protein